MQNQSKRNLLSTLKWKPLYGIYVDLDHSGGLAKIFPFLATAYHIKTFIKI